MSYWRSTTVKWDSLCPRSSLWQRFGREPSDDWAGYGVGRQVHAAIEAKLRCLPVEAPSSLTVVELRDYVELVENAETMGLLDLDHQSVELTLRSPLDGEERHWLTLKPSEGTHYSITPDAFRVEDNVAYVDDWKTQQGLNADASLDDNVQAVTYGAAVAELTGVERVVFTFWNLRFKVGQQIDKPAGWFIAKAEKLWAAMVERDKVPVADIEADFRPGEHCGRCPFRTDCLSELVDDALAGTETDDRELYRRWHALRELASMAKRDVTARVRARTSVLELEDGTQLGTQRIPTRAWSRKNADVAVRGHLWQAIAARALTEGADFSEVFEPKRPKSGGLMTWLASLPEGARDIADKNLNHGDRQTLIKLPKEK
jgi:hypothetical protein